MKKLIVLVCVLFLPIIFLLHVSKGVVWADNTDNFEFVFGDRVFYYDLNTPRDSDTIFYSHTIKHNYSEDYSSKRELLIKLNSISIPKDIAIRYAFPHIDRVIEKIDRQIYIEPVDAKLNINTNSEEVFHICKEKYGQKLDKPKLYEDIFNASR